MDLFKFNPITPSTATNLVNGEAINGATGIVWTERYQQAGDFEIVAPLSSGLKEFLLPGTLISHTDTYEVMVVENHEVPQEKYSDPTIKITGRSLETILDNRIVGANKSFPATPPLVEYLLAADYTWDQIVELINDHIIGTVAGFDAMANLVAISTVPGTGVSVERVIRRGGVYTRVLELLDIDDLGIRIYRKNPFGLFGSSTDTQIVIHKGNDKTDSVIFSWKAGDLDNFGYLHSIKNFKTEALVVGRYVEVRVFDSTKTGYERRTMLVDGSDIDGHLDVVPSGTTLTNIRTKMTTRGEQAIAAQKEIFITSADVSSTASQRYRKDYDIGDLVTVEGNFGASDTMRVVAHTEVQDENGSKSYPTLALLEE